MTKKCYRAEFKAKVEMDATRSVHYTMVGAWKRQAMESVASLFEGRD